MINLEDALAFCCETSAGVARHQPRPPLRSTCYNGHKSLFN